MEHKQRVLVFGGSDGIGRAVAETIAAGGGDVFITSRSVDKAHAAAVEINAIATGEMTAGQQGSAAPVGTVRGLAADAYGPETVASAVEAAAVDGDLTGLAYCVGSIDIRPLARSSSDDFAKSYALIVIGAAMAVKAAAKSLRASERGSIVLFSTVAAQQGFANHAVIASAKAGIEGLTVSLAAELAPHIRVNAIAPSLTDTPIAAPLIASPAVAKSLSQMHPLQRLGTPEDHAGLASFLLSGASGWISGQIIGVDGGRGRLRTSRG